MSNSEQAPCFDPNAIDSDSHILGLPSPKDSGAVYYFRRGLGTGDPENNADENFYLLHHLFTVQEQEYAQVRLDSYKDGYSKRLTAEGLTGDEIKSRIETLEKQAMARVQKESLKMRASSR